jgi:acyl carrier protein
MQETEIYGKLTKIFRDTFDQEIHLTPQTTAANVDGWDSFAHINLILAIEAEFRIRFTSAAVERIQNVGDIVTLIQQLL